eukprot:m.42823 g.42823  ORF g.42823 m.42823 type:complete len:204 (-) comp19224_c1_seq1:42-653(-)
MATMSHFVFEDTTNSTINKSAKKSSKRGLGIGRQSVAPTPVKVFGAPKTPHRKALGTLNVNTTQRRAFGDITNKKGNEDNQSIAATKSAMKPMRTQPRRKTRDIEYAPAPSNTKEPGYVDEEMSSLLDQRFSEILNPRSSGRSKVHTPPSIAKMKIPRPIPLDKSEFLFRDLDESISSLADNTNDCLDDVTDFDIEIMDEDMF